MDEFRFGEIELRPTLNGDAKHGREILAINAQYIRDNYNNYEITLRDILELGQTAPGNIDAKLLVDLREYASNVSNALTYVVAAVNDILSGRPESTQAVE